MSVPISQFIPPPAFPPGSKSEKDKYHMVSLICGTSFAFQQSLSMSCLKGGCPVGMVSHVAGVFREAALSGTPKSRHIGSSYFILPRTRLCKIVRMQWKRGNFPGLIQKEQSTDGPRTGTLPAPCHHDTLHQLGQKQEVGEGNTEPWECDQGTISGFCRVGWPDQALSRQFETQPLLSASSA